MAGGALRVLIADESDGVVDYIQHRLQMEADVEVVGTARDGEQTTQQALALRPDVAVIEAAIVNEDGMRTAPLLAHRLPQTRVIVTSMFEPGEAARQAMTAAAVEFLHKPFTGDEVLAAIRRAAASRGDDYESEQPRPPLRSRHASATPFGGGGAACEVYTVFSPEGGVGKSVIAVNLAVALSMAAGSRVALIDLSLQFGDIAAILNLRIDRTIADLATSNAFSDNDVVLSTLVDGPEGVKVLLAPLRPELADYVTTAHVHSLIEQLKTAFDYIVVDTPSHLNDITLEAIEMADEVVMLTRFGITSIKNARLALSVMDALKIEPQRVHIVANHSSAGRQAFDLAAAEGHLKQPIGLEIPHDPSTVNASINRGVPFVVASSNTPVSRAVGALAAELTPAAQGSSIDTVQAKGRFSPKLKTAAR